MSFISRHSGLVIVISKQDRLVPVHVCIWRYLIKIMFLFSMACLYSHCVFLHALLSFCPCLRDIFDAVITGLWGSLLNSLEAMMLWKGISQQCRMSPQASVMPFLPLLLVRSTSLLFFSGSDCANIFLALSLIGKSHWRCETAYELWLQKREKCSSERLGSGQSICALTCGNKRMC